MRSRAVATVAGAVLWMMPGSSSGWAPERAQDVVVVEAVLLPDLHGRPLSSLRLLACREGRCGPIPMQVDERDLDGRWVLDAGPEAGADDPPATLDGNDTLLFMAADSGERIHPKQLPQSANALELAVYDPIDGRVEWVYLLADAASLPASEISYVRYDPRSDRIHGTGGGGAGGSVAMGFAVGVPAYLSFADGDNFLDRLKVRASARLIFGLLRFSRSEADLSTEVAGWRSGPIRVIRSQRQRIRLGWGIRSPTFGSYTYFYRAAADLPVTVHLNRPATYWVSDVRIEAVLDFHSLAGWQVIIPGRAEVVIAGTGMDAAKQAINESSATWFALRGPTRTLVQSMRVSPSLMSTQRRLVYREGVESIQPPESVPGELPGIGFRLMEWEQVAAGRHDLAAQSWAIDNAVDVEAFMAAQQQPLAVRVRPLVPYGGGPAD